MIHLKSQPRNCKLAIALLFALILCSIYLFNNNQIVDGQKPVTLIKVLSSNLTATHFYYFYNYTDTTPVFYISPPSDLHRTAPDIVIAIPTVPRNNQSYIIKTVENLLAQLYDEEKHRIVIVISCNYDVNQENSEYCVQLASTLSASFDWACKQGLIELISYPEYWTPKEFPQDPLNPFNITDPPDRFYWRTKQHTDFIYLMSYCLHVHPASSFYIQLEDDVLTRKGYVSEIQRFIQKVQSKPWLTLEFSNLGFIGKLFRMQSLQQFVIHDLPLYNLIPIDWSFDEFHFRSFCKHLPRKPCVRKVYREHRISHRPPLFQHVGLYSSLAGKQQNLKEKRFSDTPLPLLIEGNKIQLANAICTDNSVTKDMIYDMYYKEKPLEIVNPLPKLKLTLYFNESASISAIAFRYHFESSSASDPLGVFINSDVQLSPPFDDLKNVQINELTIRVHREIATLVISRLTLRRP